MFGIENKNTYKKVKILIAVILSVVLVLPLYSCGSASSSSKSSKKSSSSGDTVRIGTMDLVNGDLIAREEKYYEKELGVKVKITKFDSGKDVNTALSSGSIDISELGSAPTALGIANKVGYQVFWVGDVIGSAESLVAAKGSGITSVKDLKGKKVAVPFASTSHYSLLNALKQAGLSESDVKLLDLQPDDIYAAWKRGDIDAAYVWYPVLAKLKKDGGTVITDSAKLAKTGVITADLNVVRTAYAKKHPEVVVNYVKAQIKANKVLNNDPSTAVKDISSILEISKADAKDQITQFSYLNSDQQLDYLQNKIPQTLKKTGNFLKQQGSIQSVPSLKTYKAAVTTKYLKQALK
ncbi:MAG: aliphatic sulfonate ABC transporter substrate-binding protein [Eubacterium sp.]